MSSVSLIRTDETRSLSIIGDDGLVASDLRRHLARSAERPLSHIEGQFAKFLIDHKKRTLKYSPLKPKSSPSSKWRQFSSTPPVWTPLVQAFHLVTPTASVFTFLVKNRQNRDFY